MSAVRALAALDGGGAAPEQLATAGIQVEGDASVVSRFLTALDDPDPDFAIVTS